MYLIFKSVTTAKWARVGYTIGNRKHLGSEKGRNLRKLFEASAVHARGATSASDIVKRYLILFVATLKLSTIRGTLRTSKSALLFKLVAFFQVRHTLECRRHFSRFTFMFKVCDIVQSMLHSSKSATSL